MGRRHLTLVEVHEALRNGRAVEQWLKHWIEGEERLIRWLRIHADPREGYGLTLLDVIDEGSDGFLDINEFHSVDPDEPYGSVRYFKAWEEALEVAFLEFGADKGKFVASGVIQNEYIDFIEREGFWLIN